MNVRNRLLKQLKKNQNPIMKSRVKDLDKTIKTDLQVGTSNGIIAGNAEKGLLIELKFIAKFVFIGAAFSYFDHLPCFN